jgi:hypothetical protein
VSLAGSRSEARNRSHAIQHTLFGRVNSLIAPASSQACFSPGRLRPKECRWRAGSTAPFAGAWTDLGTGLPHRLHLSPEQRRALRQLCRCSVGLHSGGHAGSRVHLHDAE